jgi:hypothetical protein
MWETLLQQADAMGLPSRFLKEVPASFVVFEFEDLRQFAAEYHPEGHRMVLNRALSLNAAGGTLKPLSRLTAPELGTLYHELFHAYMDYLETRSKEGRGGATGHPLLERAREVQNCRYGQVDITPVVAKKSLKESRYLSEHEAWEALNETWGVFVGWSVWTSAEFRSGPPGRKSDPTRKSSWLAQLKKADGEGILVGYYEPQDPVERAKTPKHYLAPSFRISPQEVIVLLEWIFEKPRDEASQVLAVMTAPLGSGNGADCRHNS